MAIGPLKSPKNYGSQVQGIQYIEAYEAMTSSIPLKSSCISIFHLFLYDHSENGWEHKGKIHSQNIMWSLLCSGKDNMRQASAD